MVSTADRRKSDRERKAVERAERKRIGVPDPVVLDRVIVNALRDCVLIGLGHDDRPAEVHLVRFRLKDVLRKAQEEYQARGLNGGACEAAILQRLAPLNGGQTKGGGQAGDSVDMSRESTPPTELVTETRREDHDQEAHDLLFSLCDEAPLQRQAQPSSSRLTVPGRSPSQIMSSRGR